MTLSIYSENKVPRFGSVGALGTRESRETTGLTSWPRPAPPDRRTQTRGLSKPRIAVPARSSEPFFPI